MYDDFAAHGFDMCLLVRKYPCKTNPAQEKWHINLPLCNQLVTERKSEIAIGKLIGAACFPEASDLWR
jgi:hypothetical protein